MADTNKHTIAVLVENKFGVLSRVAGLFSARGYNIESLSVGETLDPSVSRMTLVVRGEPFIIEQVIKQLHKLIDVIKVTDLSEENHVEREMLLLKVNAEPANRAEILRLGDIFRAKVVDVTPQRLHARGHRRGVQDRGHHRSPAALRHPGDRPHRQGGHRAGPQDPAAQGGGAARQVSRDAPSADRRSEGGRVRGLISHEGKRKKGTRNHAGQDLLRPGR